MSGYTPIRVLTPQERLEALLLAAMHEDRALLCGPGQEGLRKLFELTAELLQRFARHDAYASRKDPA